MTVAFDTLAVSHRLRSGGFSDAQATAMTEAISIGIHGGIATRDDIAEVRTEIAELRTELRAEIAELRTELRAEIAELRTELRAEIAELRTEMHTRLGKVENDLKWMKVIGGTIGGITLTLLGAILTLLVRNLPLLF